MTQIVIFPDNAGVSILNIGADCPLPIEAIARKDVPGGVPYRIVNADFFDSQISQGADRENWTADFSSPDGYGSDKYGVGTNFDIVEILIDDDGLLEYQVRHSINGKLSNVKA